MNDAQYFALAADAVLILHVLVILFVVLGLILILLGKKTGWSWVHNPWFRVTHLMAIATVMLQSWLGVLCPLTIWEMKLRSLAGQATYTGSFIAHWLGTLIYYDLPGWLFTLGYSLFAFAVIISWIWVRPRKFFR